MDYIEIKFNKDKLDQQKTTQEEMEKSVDSYCLPVGFEKSTLEDGTIQWLNKHAIQQAWKETAKIVLKLTDNKKLVLSVDVFDWGSQARANNEIDFVVDNCIEAGMEDI